MGVEEVLPGAGRLELIEAALDQASDAVLITDAGPMAEDSPKSVYANAQFEQLTGHPRESALGRTPLLLRHADTDVAAIRRLQEAYRERRQATVEVTVGHRDGHPCHVEMSLSPLHRGGGSVTHWIAILRDLTERRRAQSALLQNSRVDAVARLAAGVAHDFNNLLTVIATSAELALGEIEQAHPAHGPLTDILGAAERARTHTGQLLAVTRLEDARPQLVDVVAVVRAARTGVQRVAGATIGVHLTLPAMPVHARVAAGQVEQALLSLVANARDAQPAGGEVRIAVRRSGDRAVITVEDDGPGLPAGAEDQAFEPFWSTKPRGSGAGLGLPTVRWIVSRAGGSVRVERAGSGGARVVLELPVQEAPAC